MIPKLNRSTFLIALIFVFIFLASRLWHLTIIPVFGDEAIYLRWSQVIRAVDTLRFLPLTDGKQPLFMWLTIPFFKIISDPLLAGRLLAVLAGLVNALTLFFITGTWFAPFLYLLFPFTFFFDRLALPDSLLSLFGSLSLLFSLLLAKHPRLDLSLILGGILGFSWLTKSPAIFFIILSFLTFLIYNPNFKKIKFFVYPLISIFLAFSIYNLLRLGPQFHQISLRNRDYVWPISEILRHPLDPLKPHLSDIVTLFSRYLSLPLLFFVFIFKSFPQNKKLYLVLVSWFIFPLLTNAIFAKVFTARYILFTIPPLISLLALIISQAKIPYSKIILTLFFLPNLYFLYHLSASPQKLTLPSTETGYIMDWTSGWGIKESAQFLINRSSQANVIVGTEGYFGTLPDGLQIYTNNISHLTVIGVGIGFEQIPLNLVNAKNFGDEVYLLLNHSRLRLTPEELAKLTIVSQYPKPSNDKLILFRL